MVLAAPLPLQEALPSGAFRGEARGFGLVVLRRPLAVSSAHRQADGLAHLGRLALEVEPARQALALRRLVFAGQHVDAAQQRAPHADQGFAAPHDQGEDIGGRALAHRLAVEADEGQPRIEQEEG